MADVTETLTTLKRENVNGALAAAPDYVTGSFVADDTNNHDFKYDARGKGRFTVAIDNPSDQDLTVTPYGMHERDGAVGDVGTFPITDAAGGSQAFTVSATSKEYVTCFDPFPFYLFRIAAGSTPDGSRVSVFVDLSAY